MSVLPTTSLQNWSAGSSHKKLLKIRWGVRKAMFQSVPLVCLLLTGFFSCERSMSGRATSTEMPILDLIFVSQFGQTQTRTRNSVTRTFTTIFEFWNFFKFLIDHTDDELTG